MTRAGVVVIGVGNEAAGDDAIGLEVVRALATQLPEPRPRIVETDGEPSRLLDAWDDAELAVVVDAARTGVDEGVVVLDGLADALADDDGRSGHGLGLSAAIRLGRGLGRLPDALVVVAVGGEWFSPGFGLSPAGHRHARQAVGVVADLLGGAGVGPGPALRAEHSREAAEGSVGVGLDRRDGEADVTAQPAGEIESEPA